MSITKEEKQSLISKFKVNDNDTGSAEVQIALLTKRINNLTQHLKINKKDFSTRRGLLMLVGRRRNMLLYLKNKDHSKYESLIKELGIRKVS